MAISPLPILPRRPMPREGACMDARELAGWDVANARCGWQFYATSPCRDCTEAFAAEMRFEGRCHGRPGSDVSPAELAALRPVEPPISGAA